jgi:CBS domain containing-hemolysin-like protein
VYESARQNIVGILYVKDLILVDPDDETELSAVLAFRCACACLSALPCPSPAAPAKLMRRT